MQSTGDDPSRETVVKKLYILFPILRLDSCNLLKMGKYMVSAQKLLPKFRGIGGKTRTEGVTVMKRELALVAAVLTIALSGTATSATVALYDNLSAASSGTDPIESFGPLYDSFSTDGSALVLAELELLLSATNHADGGTVSVGLYLDSSTAPGALIISLGTILDSSLTSTLSVIDLAGLSANLSANTRYWIGLSSSESPAPQSSALWSWSLDTSGTGVSGEFFANRSGVFNNNFGPYQMNLTGSTVPEPGALALVGLALAGLAASRRRKH